MVTYTVMRGDHGWAMVPPTRRFHFYDADQRSLCRTRVNVGVPADAYTTPTGSETMDPKDCAACWEKLNKRPIEPTDPPFPDPLQPDSPERTP